MQEIIENHILIEYERKAMERRNFLKLGLAGIGTLALTNEAQALKYYPTNSDKKYAVLYGSWCGSTRDAACWISEGMAGIADVFDVREEELELQEFEHIIVGGAIRYGVTSQELQDYITENQSWLKDKVCGLFAVCGNMGQPVGEEQTNSFINEHLATLCGVEDVPSKVFLGRITKSLMEEEVAEAMATFEDYDNLKRPECMEFGKKILEAVEEA